MTDEKLAEPVNRLVLVTGASGGIGRAIVRRLASDGYGIVAQYRSRHENAQEIIDEIEAKGGYIWAVQADLISRPGIRLLVDRVAEVLDLLPGSELAGVVNNAAAMLGPSFGAATIEEFDEYFAINTRAPLFVTQGLAEHMGAGCSVVNISSVATHIASANDILYAMSKAALEAFTRHSAEALAKLGARVNCVLPGFTDNGHPAFQVAAVREHMGSYSVLGGVADADVVADAVAFLISDQSRRTTGSILDVSGGGAVGALRAASATVSLRAFADGEYAWRSVAVED